MAEGNRPFLSFRAPGSGARNPRGALSLEKAPVVSRARVEQNWVIIGIPRSPCVDSADKVRTEGSLGMTSREGCPALYCHSEEAGTADEESLRRA